MENLTKERQLEIENLVNSLLKQNGYDEDKDDYVNISGFISRLGFNVGTTELNDDEEGFVVIRVKDYPRTDDLGDKVIGVNRNLSFEVKRFVIAYEYAHSVLKYKKMDYFSHRKLIKEKTKEEPDVLYFAKALLVPRFSFERTLKYLKSNGIIGNALIAQLASIYKVPTEDIINRILDTMDLGDSYEW